MSSLNVAKYVAMNQWLDKIFKEHNKEIIEAIDSITLEHARLDITKFPGFTYCGNRYFHSSYSAYPVYQLVRRLHDSLTDKMVTVMNKIDNNNKNLSLVKSYIAACLSKHESLDIAKGYLIDCLDSSTNSLVDLKVKEEIEKTHAEAIDIIKENMTLTLLKG